MEYPISELLSFAKNSGASDLHLIAGFEPIIFLDGILKRVHGPALTEDEINEMIRDVLNDEQKTNFEAHRFRRHQLLLCDRPCNAQALLAPCRAGAMLPPVAEAGFRPQGAGALLPHSKCPCCEYR